MRCRPHSDIVDVDGFAPSTHGLVPAALHAELYGIPYILQASPKPSELFCPEWGIPFSPALPYCFVHFVAIARNHSANVSCPTFPRPYTTTYLSRMLLYESNHTHPVGLTDSEITYVRLLYSRPSFMSPISTRSSVWSLSMPFQFRHPASPVLQYVSLLTGIALCTSLGVCGRCGSRTRFSSQALQGITQRCAPTIPLIPSCRFAPLFPAFSFLYLNSFMSSYSPSTMF